VEDAATSTALLVRACVALNGGSDLAVLSIPI
jgi:hypothetical protein